VTTYDPDVIKEFARRLYVRAGWVELLSLAAGAIIGLVFATPFARGEFGQNAFIVGIFLGGIAGYFYGSQKSFMYKLLAQQALCQAQIEENTRRPVSQAARPPSPPSRPAGRGDSYTVPMPAGPFVPPRLK
jgi:predicted lipid-binding transport protein (Tim44 family)